MKDDLSNLREEYLSERREFQARGRLAKIQGDEMSIMETIVKIISVIMIAALLYAIYITFM